MCDRVSELKSAIDANAETNSKAHIVLKNEIVRTQQAVIIYTGKAIP